jgi:hypothetical protein
MTEAQFSAMINVTVDRTIVRASDRVIRQMLSGRYGNHQPTDSSPDVGEDAKERDESNHTGNDPSWESWRTPPTSDSDKHAKERSTHVSGETS